MLEETIKNFSGIQWIPLTPLKLMFYVLRPLFMAMAGLSFFFLLSVSTGLSSSIGIIFSVVDLCPYLIFLSLLGPIGAPATLANVILCNHPLGGSLIFIVSIPFSLDTSYREAQLSSINMHWYVIPPLANKAN